MAAAQDTVALNPEELNPTDRAILDELQSGRSTPAYIADVHEYTAGNVRNRMTSLDKHGHVRALGGGLYELTDDPREDARDDAQATTDRLREELEECREQLASARESSADTDAALRAIDDAEAAAERGDGAALQDALGRAKGAINDG